MKSITRRDFNKMCASGLLAAGLAGCTHSSNKRKPNIVYILADDLGYGDLSCYGQTKFRTPNIDRLAAEGMRFTDHYAGSTVCAPSRSCLMTGKHTGHTTVRGNSSRRTGQRVPLKASDVTVAVMLRKNGYATGMTGKWGLGEPGTAGIPNKQGFDFWFGYLNQHNAHYYYPPYLWNNTQKLVLNGNKDGKKGQYSHDLFTKEALSFIEDNQQNPFFLYIPYTIPHAQLVAPEDSLEKFKGKYPETPFKGSDSYPPNPWPHATYAAMIDRMDRDVGRIMQKLKDLGLDDNTIVFFASDNGPERGPKHGCDPDFFNSSGPLRGVKRDLYEGGIRVPLIVRWPGKIESGTASNHVSAFWDMMPTLADVAGVKCPGDIDGISFLPELLGKDQPKHDYLYWEYPIKGFWQAVRMKNWKGIQYQPENKFELFDLAKDVGEKNNVADQYPEIVSKMKAIMKKAHVESPDWPSETV